MRIEYLSGPRTFQVFVGLVLLYLGARLLYDAFVKARVPDEADEGTGQGIVTSGAETGLAERQAGGAVGSGEVSLRRVEYAFRSRTYSFGTAPVFLLSLVVGVVGGVYGVGGGAIIAPSL